MATPQSMVSFDGANARKNNEQITFRFCSECSNMLYPKEDQDAHKLQYTCRTCQYTEEAQSSCIFRNELNTSAGETAGVTQDVGSDPTVGTTTIVNTCTCTPTTAPQEEEDRNPGMPMFCITCSSLICCDTCGVSSPKLLVKRLADTTSKPKMGFFQLNLSLMDPEDPFEDYDEEMMDVTDGNGDTTDETDDDEFASSPTGLGQSTEQLPKASSAWIGHRGYDSFTADGAMVFKI